MTELAKALGEYMALRRALGYKLTYTARELPRFVQFVDDEDATSITTELALRWAQEDPNASSVTHSDRLSMVRRFAAWRRTEDPRTEVPPRRLLPRRYERPTPYIYSAAEIESLVRSAGHLASKRGLLGLTCSTLFGLLAVSGLRIGEAVALDVTDVDFRTGVLTIRTGKCGKSRFIPIHTTTTSALEYYLKQRNLILPRAKTPAIFVSERGLRMTAFAAGDNFVKVSCMTGLRPYTEDGSRGRGPRLHDLRHRFAVQTLINWYRAGADVDCEIPKLATYLGHKGPTEVYWYLQAVPKLLRLAMERSIAPAGGDS